MLATNKCLVSQNSKGDTYVVMLAGDWQGLNIEELAGDDCQ
jgi:hypothetical protein